MTDDHPTSPPPLTPALWRRVSTVLDSALELEGAERAAYLDRVYTEEPELEPHVESLLAADSQADGFLEEAVGSSAVPILTGLGTGEPPVSDDLPPGTEIPPFRLEQQIGQGGMGTVYLANRTDGQFEQRIALKVVKRGMDTDVIRQRFLAERQILARLEHANIARLLDGGVTPDGRPFFAMEYVEGSPITGYADASRLTVDERLSLFMDVCRAVRHAQQHLIVHRDLKPSNVLVTSDGVVKLLDFGVAKVLGAEDGDAVTRLGTRVMTPEYAAPEQLRGEPVTTATDVYSLGALLYELLSGRRPHHIPQATPADLERNVLTTDPKSMSKASLEDVEILHRDGTRSTHDATAVAGARRASPRSLSRQLSGDLSVIVEKALQRRPDERYASADAILGDLERYRSGLPILARRPSVRYRVAKHLRRHRLAAVLVGLVVMALGIGYVSTVHQARQTSRQAHRATLVKDFLVSLFAEADPNVVGGSEFTAADLLDRGAERVGRQLAGEPEVQVELLEMIGSLYRDLGEYESAGPVLAEAARIQMERFGPDDLRVAKSLNLQAGNELLASNLVGADSLLQRALVIEDAQGDPDGLQRGEILSNLASLRRRSGDYDDAGRLYREVIRIDRAHFGSDHLNLATDLNNYAVFLDEIGHADSAEALHRQALDIQQAELPRDHTDIARSMVNLADVLRSLSRPDEADSLYQEAISMRRRLYDGAHPDLANSLRALARVREENGDLDTADDLLREALAMSRELLGDDHTVVANCYNQVGILAYQRGDYDAARSNIREALVIWERTLPPEHATLWTVRGNLAAVEMLIGDAASAEAQYRKALAFHRDALGPKHPTVASDLNNLGAAIRFQDRFDEATVHHRDALMILSELHEPTHRDVLFGRYLLAVALTGTQRYEEAEAHLRETLALAEEQLPVGHRTIVDIRMALGRLLVATDRAPEAHALLVSARDEWQASSARPTYRTGATLATLGACLIDLERTVEAESLLVRGHTILLETLGPNSPRTRQAASDLARLNGSHSLSPPGAQDR